MTVLNSRVKGFIKLGLAHHPICWQFREHTINIRGINFCLGCVGFYSGCLCGFFISLFGFFSNFTWIKLTIIAAILWLPTVFRLLNINPFNTPKKWIKFVLRYLLGLGIAIGIISILIAPSFLLQVLQIIVGLVFYSAITIHRVKKGPREWDNYCRTCTFIRNRNCPGMNHFFS